MAKKQAKSAAEKLQLSDDAVAICGTGAASFMQMVALMTPKQRQLVVSGLRALADDVEFLGEDTR
jgi:hypothetical protein